MLQVDYNTRRIDGIHLPIPTGLTPERLIKQIYFSRYARILKGKVCATESTQSRTLTPKLLIPQEDVTHEFENVSWQYGTNYITADVVFHEHDMCLLTLFLTGKVDFVPVSFRATDDDTAVTFLGWDLSTKPW